MLEQVLDVSILGAHVAVGSESCQTVIEKIDPQRMNTEEENIHP
jgi:hypothetical protein